MCRSVYLLVLVFSIYRIGLSSSSAVTVIAGENITLHCNISPSIEMFWYRHIDQELTMILSATEGILDKDLAANYNQDPDHFQMLFQNHSGHISLSLIIVDVRQSDIGLYYCGARREGTVAFARAVHLQFTDAVKYTSGSVQCWTPLIAVCCSFALMLTLCLSVIYKRGLPSSSCTKCVKDKDMKEADLHYASLRHSATPQTRNVSPANLNVIYDTVAKKVTNNPRV
ncbi:hypothetical protein KOW79_012665 [Hemibagrus wyckioides]|uniref:Ig-like domain-containing protein n=1 Tax=Hemibagrus wyckioides TaxID=337641 RepID=A0A9D3SMF7_9TELE|nr:uncharacterized protein LOC131364516 [Hemibagrus wyckioides]KAG7324649.1 hypothetical protein KOW79_012665 [Hemibagrus wyckioides]